MNENKNWDNIQDTQYACKLMYNLIKNHLEFLNNKYFKKKIWTVKGIITSRIRKSLEIEKVRDNDVHHAIDAVIIAITTQNMITYEEPWENFKKELEIRTMYKTREEIVAKLKQEKIYYKNYDEVRPIFVSRMPQRKITGKAHLDTIKRLKNNEGELKTYIKTNIEDLKLDSNNEIYGYPIENRKSDKLLYTALKEQLLKFSGDAKQAFKEEFYKTTSNGSRGPLVKKVKIESNLTLGVELNNKKAIAGNGDCIRIDIFHVNGEGYYFIPIYISDTIKQNLPNKACISTKKYADWKEMREKDFLFSLYKNDLICIKSNKNITLTNRHEKSNKVKVNEIMAYYSRCIISTGAISIQTPDGKYMVQSLGIKKLEYIKKYNVDILGNYYEINLPEKRMSFNLKNKKS